MVVGVVVERPRLVVAPQRVDGEGAGVRGEDPEHVVGLGCLGEGKGG